MLLLLFLNYLCKGTGEYKYILSKSKIHLLPGCSIAIDGEIEDNDKKKRAQEGPLTNGILNYIFTQN